MGPSCTFRALRPAVMAGIMALLMVASCENSDDEVYLDVQQPPPTLNSSTSTWGDRRWTVLFDGRELGGWRLLSGCMELEGGAISLNHPFCGMTIVLAEEVRFRDGEVEVTLEPLPTSRPMQPYVIALRSRVSLNWSSLYFICYPDRMEVARGSARLPNPPPELTVYYEPVESVLTWRFVLRDRLVEVYRLGTWVATYYDEHPQSGTLAIGADGWGLHVLNVRVRPDNEE